MNFTRSNFLLAVQCPRMLWLNQYKESKTLKEMNRDKNLILTASQLFEKVTVVEEMETESMIEKTRELLDKKGFIANATFKLNECVCTVDLLNCLGNNEYEIYTVKADTRIDDVYRDDIAYQNYVLSECGLDVKDIYLILMNAAYERMGDLDVNALFNVLNMTECAKSRFKPVDERIEFVKKALLNPDEPEYEKIGTRCHNYSECPYFEHCTKDLVKPNVFDIKYLLKRTAYNLYLKNIVSFKDILKEKSVSDEYLIQVEHELNQLETYVDDSVKSFMDTLKYPVTFVEIYSVSNTIPMYDHTWTNAHVSYGYKLTDVEACGKVNVTEKVFDKTEDHRNELAASLKDELKNKNCLVAYNATPVNNRIRELGRYFEKDLLTVKVNDLMHLFSNRLIYDKKMNGSYELSAVLKAFECETIIDLFNKLKRG